MERVISGEAYIRKSGVKGHNSSTQAFWNAIEFWIYLFATCYKWFWWSICTSHSNQAYIIWKAKID